MATVKFFNGTNELTRIEPMRNAEFAARFPGQTAKRFDSLSRLVGKDSSGTLLPVERSIDFKSRPSLHKCDSRCMNAKGHNCECECGGKNHGRGFFCKQVAA